MATTGYSYGSSAALPCRYCGQGFREDDAVILYSSRRFHKRCLCCNTCRKGFSDEKDPGIQGAVRDLPYCSNCFAKAATDLCGGCGESIEKKWIEPKGIHKKYHDGCFKCTNCGIVLTAAFKKKNNLPVCVGKCPEKPAAAEAPKPSGGGKFCQQCGVKRKDQEKFCQECGAGF